jgi:hypothetical protein
MQEPVLCIERDAIGGEARLRVVMERNRSTAAVASSGIRDRPGVKGGIGRDVGWERLEGVHGVPIQGAKGGHIAFMEGLGAFGEDDLTGLGSGSRSDA